MGAIETDISYRDEGKVKKAVQEYLDRKARRSHPDGYFDNGGRWYPDDKYEWQKCCSSIRSPSRRFPYSYMLHCRTKKHVANLFGIPEEELKDALKKQKYIL